MFENYILCADAIAHCLNFHPKKSWKDVTSAEVQKQLDKITEASTIEDVHGSAVLDSIFKSVAGDQLRMSKPERAVVILKWILANSAESMRPLFDELMDALPR